MGKAFRSVRLSLWVVGPVLAGPSCLGISERQIGEAIFGGPPTDDAFGSKESAPVGEFVSITFTLLIILEK